MVTIIRRPIFNPQRLAALLEEAGANTTRVFENLIAPYRFTVKDGVSTVSVDLAGFTKDDIEVSVDETSGVLSIKAEVGSEPAGEDGESKDAIQGFYNRKVNLRFNMPSESDYESVKSDYTDGVLSVTFGIKVPEKAEPRKINVA